MAKYSRAVITAMLLFLLVNISNAQTPLTVLENRLCKTWNIHKIEQNNKVTNSDKEFNNFVLILKENHTSLQGINPDGLIKGKWSVNEKEMQLVIKDDAMNQEYTMKIVSLSLTELILQDATSDALLKIYYQSK